MSAAPREAEPSVKAAGGVVWRTADDGRIEVLLVHRPRYDDWSLPKGKREPGERDEECALREIEEETGFLCTPGRELPGTRYRDAKGRRKHVRYWEMQVRGGAFVANEEVDSVRWLPVDAAETLLSYPRDRPVLREFTKLALLGAPHSTGGS